MGTYAFEEQLWQIIPRDYLNEYEKEELVTLIAGFDSNLYDLIIQQVAAIWPVSSALCFSFLEDLETLLQRISPTRVSEWVREILEVFESEGLRAARAFMEDTDNIFFQRLRGHGILSFDQIAPKLLPYTRGLAKRSIMLGSADHAGTDTSTIFLPHEISIFPTEKQNFLLYKFIATFQWALITNDCYCHTSENYSAMREALSKYYNRIPDSPNEVVLEFFFNCFPEKPLAEDIYSLLYSIKAAGFLREYVPGLMRDAQFIFEHIMAQRFSGRKSKPVGVLEDIAHWLLLYCMGRKKTVNFTDEIAEVLSTVHSPHSSSLDIMDSTHKVYELCVAEENRTVFIPFIFQGKLNPLSAHQARLVRREESKQHFITALSAMILPQSESQETIPEEADRQISQGVPEDDGISMVPQRRGEREDKKQRPEEKEIRYVQIKDQLIDLPEELRDMASEIVADLGEVPSSYIDSAQKIAGSGFRAQSVGAGDDDTEFLDGESTYDEWDFRRQGFRKNWCRLIERKVHATKGTFVDSTLGKYRGQIIQIKRQFEMMRTQYRFIKRQRDGDDIDIEALTVALGDSRAGQSPSDRLFIRLLRDERDIATLFLVDMSSSTEGWVGNALKEALLILCEALESLGDRYAIYGFSGMRRSRNIIFHVKGFDEIYSDEIRGRIAAIAPMDYTRMGTPIRHFTEVLKQQEAKVRLLIILTDGKPEDYDDYKGDYAIEDTRHALIEAKSAGIHPFCITIDKEAQDYMAHMLGEINYAFINNVRKLPLRVPEIYRTLTS